MPLPSLCRGIKPAGLSRFEPVCGRLIIRLLGLILACNTIHLMPVSADPLESIANPLKANHSWVADNARVLDAANKTRIDDLLGPVERDAGVEVAVVTVASLDGEPIRAYARQLFRKWGIGGRAEMRGVLILLAVSEARAHIEVGYALKTELPDDEMARILAKHLQPALREKKYGNGLWEAARAVALCVEPNVNVPATGGSVSAAPNGEAKGTKPLGAKGTIARNAMVPVLALVCTAWLLWGVPGRKKCPHCRGRMRRSRKRAGKSKWHCPSCRFNEDQPGRQPSSRGQGGPVMNAAGGPVMLSPETPRHPDGEESNGVA